VRKDSSQVGDFPVEIVGRDNLVRRYSYDEAVRLDVPFQEVPDDGGGDVVGKVRDERPHRRIGQHPGPVQGVGISLDDANSRGFDPLAQQRHQMAIDLDGGDGSARLGQRKGEGPEAGPDLDDGVTGTDPGHPHDPPNRGSRASPSSSRCGTRS